jgi:hypothetical protein
VHHVIELSRESGAVALLFCILFRRAVCRYKRNFSFRALRVYNITLDRRRRDYHRHLNGYSNVSRASRESEQRSVGERERERERVNKRERRSHDDGRTGSSCTGTVFTFSVISTATQIGSFYRTAIRVLYFIIFATVDDILCITQYTHSCL